VNVAQNLYLRTSPWSIAVSKIYRVVCKANLLHQQPSQPWNGQSQVEKLLENPDGILRALDGMTGRPGILIYLIIITVLEALIAEKVDGLVVDTGKMLSWVRFSLDMLQAVCLIPAVREDIEGDLAADRVAGDV
jgi:hypothetical protein